jgi:hypothetical protein
LCKAVTQNTFATSYSTNELKKIKTNKIFKMKKIIMTLAIAASSLFAFAGGGNVNENVLNAFNTEFNGAKDVKWIESSDYYKAEFVFNGQHVSAFYSTAGELMGVTRHITSQDLPETLRNKLQNDYAEDFWITGLSEVSTADETYYYVTMENADGKVVLKSSGKKWNTIKKMTKA